LTRFSGNWTKSLEKNLIVYCFVLCYILHMTVTQTVEIPESHRLVIDVPREVPAGRTVIIFNPAPYRDTDIVSLPGRTARTVEEALQMAAEQAADPDRKPISRHFGKHKGIFGGDGVAYQRAIRDEWD
jgi:hypothetical protein